MTTEIKHGHAHAGAASEIVEAANKFLASLSEDQKAKATIEYTKGERFFWYYPPLNRSGLPLRDMDDSQRALAMEVIKSTMSEEGFNRSELIMELEDQFEVKISDEDALRSAGRALKESAVQAVKLEGGDEKACSRVRTLARAGIPVMGHLGLTPQSIYKFGTYTVRAKEEEEAAKLIEDSKLLEQAGCFCIVYEKIPAELAAEASKSLTIPTIGIGAGPDCDGQVLVLHDLLGITHEFNPRFLRRYMQLYDEITSAVQNYVSDVRSGDFPNEDESY